MLIVKFLYKIFVHYIKTLFININIICSWYKNEFEQKIKTMLDTFLFTKCWGSLGN